LPYPIPPLLMKIWSRLKHSRIETGSKGIDRNLYSGVRKRSILGARVT
jgi:hypothetical protein